MKGYCGRIAKIGEADLKFCDRAYALYVRELNFKSNKAYQSETTQKR